MQPIISPMIIRNLQRSVLRVILTSVKISVDNQSMIEVPRKGT